MNRAIEIAAANAAAGLGPFGAVVVRGDKIIAEGTNQVTSTFDPTAHAEIVAIRNACDVMGSFQLTGCELYASCEPCPMCLGAIYWARPDRVYYASTRHDAAAAGFDDDYIYTELAVAPGDRQLKMTRIIRDEASEPFRVWTENRDRIPY
ncbi:MAG: nucleoside deaminase [Rhodothermales bacterium]|nr:nucleoside deaminase [Rhodothermales bacterium]